MVTADVLCVDKEVEEGWVLMDAGARWRSSCGGSCFLVEFSRSRVPLTESFSTLSAKLLTEMVRRESTEFRGEPSEWSDTSGDTPSLSEPLGVTGVEEPNLNLFLNRNIATRLSYEMWTETKQKKLVWCKQS